MLNLLFREPRLLQFYRLASWIYGRPSSLVVRDRKGRVVSTIDSEQGVRQGCVLGSLLFAVATMPMLTDLKADFPDVEVIAYLDDVILVGQHDRCLAALDQLATEAKLLLKVQPESLQA